MTDNLVILRNLARADLFSDSKYKGIVQEAKKLYRENKLKECVLALSKLPTEEQLLETLLAKLKGKSVHTNIRRILEGKTASKFEDLKAYSSILTHIFIECQTNKEYELLIEPTMKQIYKML